jgi:hypothetical protein
MMGGRVEVLHADAEYTGGGASAATQQHGMPLVVVKRAEASKGFVLPPRRRVVERSFA